MIKLYTVTIATRTKVVQSTPATIDPVQVVEGSSRKICLFRGATGTNSNKMEMRIHKQVRQTSWRNHRDYKNVRKQVMHECSNLRPGTTTKNRSKSAECVAYQSWNSSVCDLLFYCIKVIKCHIWNVLPSAQVGLAGSICLIHPSRLSSRWLPVFSAR